MCEPTAIMTMVTVSKIAAMAAGGATSMYGQYQQGKAAEEAGEYNAKMKEKQAEHVGQQASFEARQRIKQNRQDVAKGKVSAAGSGISLDSGSVLDWEGDMESALGTDLAAIEHNASLQQYGLNSGAALDRMEGQSAKTASRWKMASTAFSTIGSIASGGWNYSQAGTP